jgi:hypothetical protein
MTPYLNPHLNLFRFFNDTVQQEFIENNLSRGFAICLRNDPLFFSHYVQAIVSKDDYDYLFSVYSKGDGYYINIQQDMTSLDIDEIRKVYAIAMTSDEMLDMSDFDKQTHIPGRDRHITDVWIQIKDIAFVIEVKRTASDCKGQLFNQVSLLRQSDSSREIIPKNFSWQNVISVMEKVNVLNKLTNSYNTLIEDFLLLTESRYPDWFPAKPFFVLRFSPDEESAEYVLLNKRLRQCVAKSNYELAGFSNRLAIAVPFGWASEVQVGFHSYEDKKDKNYIAFYIWPGNTKGQGYSIYGKPMDWLEKDSFVIDGQQYELDIAFNIKFYTYSYVSGITFYGQDLRGPLIHTEENFRDKSGRWERRDWSKFESFLDEHFQPGFNWREVCNWEEYFVQSGKSQFACSFGFEATLYIPFAEFAEIDRRIDDVNPSASKLTKILDTFRTLI